MTSIALGIATVLGLGLAPFAPGTVGSAAGLVLWAALPKTDGWLGLAIIAVAVVGTWAAGVAERRYQVRDPGAVVIDEVLGMLITLFAIRPGWRLALVGFVLFRLFDVIKPYPSNRLERLPGGIGIMADDAMAAVYANIGLRAIMLLLPGGWW
jgi:phosphatidylglycerophosphatase A